MNIDQVIQSRFRNDKHRVGVNLIYTANWFSDQVSSILKKFDITMQQYNILRIIRGAHPKPVTIKYVRERMLDKMSDVSRVVEKLREKGLINRKECASDRRNVDITLTETGYSKMTEMDLYVDQVDICFATLNEEEIIQLSYLLDKLRG
jgi:DNA-binding MarR family transcriptional regulator